jgi:NAD(P)-dependent dehydrogenase (short-subunit alcohol dehydrogenase family)
MTDHKTTGHRFLLIGGLDDTTAALGAALEAAGATVQYAGAADGAVLFSAPFATVTLDDPDALAGEIAALDGFDTAVFLAGWRKFARFMDMSADDWDAAIMGNFERTTLAAQACARRLVAQGQGGRLIFITSMTALMPFAEATAVGTTLAAVHAIARMAGVDLAPHGITANVVAPGWLAGDAFDALPAETQAHIRAGIPLARTGSADELAEVVRFLASAQGGYINGAILPMDGGYTLTRSPGRTLLAPEPKNA